MRRLVLGLLGSCLWLSAPAMGQIYRSVDEQGNVVFSDVPPRQEDGAKPVVVAPVNTYATPEPPAPAKPAGSAAAAVDAGYYGTIEIVDPTPDEAIRENSGNVTVAVATVPPVRSDHRLALTLDGRLLDIEAAGNVFTLTNVDRGSHTLVAQIRDAGDAAIAESAPVTFHLLRVRLPPPAPPKPTPKAN